MTAVFLYWIFLVPFVMVYGAYEGPKVFWLWIGGFFLTIFWIVRMVLNKKLKIQKNIRGFAVWTFIVLISSLFGIHPAQSLIGGSYRHQGVLFFFTLFLMYQTKEILPNSIKKHLAKWFALSVISESILVLVDKILHFSRRPLGTIGEPNAVAGFLAFGLYWVLSLQKIKPWVRFFLCSIVFGAILATESRSGIITALIVMFGSVFVELKMIISKKQIYWKFAVGSVAVVILSLFFVFRIYTNRPVSLYENRILYWKMAIQEISQKPLLGFGAESGEAVFAHAFEKEKIQLFNSMVDRSHNLFLDVLMWSGVVGLCVFLWWIGLFGRSLLMQKEWLRFTAFLGWFLFASFQPVGVVHWVSLIFFM